MIFTHLYGQQVLRGVVERPPAAAINLSETSQAPYMCARNHHLLGIHIISAFSIEIPQEVAISIEISVRARPPLATNHKVRPRLGVLLFETQNSSFVTQDS